MLLALVKTKGILVVPGGDAAGLFAVGDVSGPFSGLPLFAVWFDGEHPARRAKKRIGTIFGFTIDDSHRFLRGPRSRRPFNLGAVMVAARSRHLSMGPASQARPPLVASFHSRILSTGWPGGLPCTGKKNEKRRRRLDYCAWLCTMLVAVQLAAREFRDGRVGKARGGEWKT